MIKNAKVLSIVLLEDVSFKLLIPKIEKAFSLHLSSYNDKGRFIGNGESESYYLTVVDRIDDLSEILTDENHVIEFILKEDRILTDVENEVRTNLKSGNIKWKSGITYTRGYSKDLKTIFP